MRLLNVHTLELKYFHHPPRLSYDRVAGPRGYAVLSHVWGYDEASFEEWTTKRTALYGRAGYNKIVACCKRAKADGIPYLWIDTCCIDKRSSAELSEAINSMFRWYREADVCYAYLADVPSTEDPAEHLSHFSRSKWFRRGWTLQELLAPYEVVFLADDWREIGTKKYLHETIEQITRIDYRSLVDGTWRHNSVARIMSWASERKTTRVEDEAYCLMGLFDVNMPLIYGEGNKAFYRLQMEIMAKFDDSSIFAWALTRREMINMGENTHHGLLAESPSQFAQSAKIVLCRDQRERCSFRIDRHCIFLGAQVVSLHAFDGAERATVKGIDPDILEPYDEASDGENDLLPLAAPHRILCVSLGCEDENGAIAIAVEEHGPEMYARFSTFRVCWVRIVPDTSMPRQDLKVLAQTSSSMMEARLVRKPIPESTFVLRTLPIHTNGYCLSAQYPSNFLTTEPKGLTASPPSLGIFIKKTIGFLGTIIFFFEHKTNVEDNVPFAIRLDRVGEFGSHAYKVRCRVGKATEGWRAGHDDNPREEEGDDEVLVGGKRSDIALSADKILRFRPHRREPGSENFVIISIEPRLCWQGQGEDRAVLRSTGKKPTAFAHTFGSHGTSSADARRQKREVDRQEALDAVATITELVS